MAIYDRPGGSNAFERSRGARLRGIRLGGALAVDPTTSRLFEFDGAVEALKKVTSRDKRCLTPPPPPLPCLNVTNRHSQSRPIDVRSLPYLCALWSSTMIHISEVPVPHSTNSDRTKMSQPPLQLSGGKSESASNQSQDNSTDQNLQPRVDASGKATAQQHAMQQGLTMPNSEDQSNEIIAIVDIWPGYHNIQRKLNMPNSYHYTGHCDITDEQREQLARGAQGPLPDGDDFADQPIKPYSPEDPPREWAMGPKAWVEEKDSKGRTIWRNLFLDTQQDTRPCCLLDPNKNQTTIEQDMEGVSSRLGPLEHPEEK
ncbi:hypothetical protein BKA64DRAFT_636750 [Cadophora sp. MPI-SDFR-AT-0126]|nr:hypothetical protein BKA64DRAFT_636750 [Leotiomycetes sp. MPI-SDFR-AT-0126]